MLPIGANVFPKTQDSRPSPPLRSRKLRDPLPPPVPRRPDKACFGTARLNDDAETQLASSAAAAVAAAREASVGTQVSRHVAAAAGDNMAQRRSWSAAAWLAHTALHTNGLSRGRLGSLPIPGDPHVGAASGLP